MIGIIVNHPIAPTEFSRWFVNSNNWKLDLFIEW